MNWKKIIFGMAFAQIFTDSYGGCQHFFSLCLVSAPERFSVAVRDATGKTEECINVKNFLFK
jgi:hypothetical protein